MKVWAAVAAAVAAAACVARAEAQVFPPPQSIAIRDERVDLRAITLVGASDADAAAIAEATRVLEAAGSRVGRAADPEPRTIPLYVSGPSLAANALAVLERLGVAPPAELPPQGYVLVATPQAIVLAGRDAPGTYWGVQTLRQLLAAEGRRARLPGAVVRDWPAIAHRGVIEGFYGPPWSHQDRLDTIAFCAANKLDTYVYAPKDDPYHRERWREPYPPERLAELGALAREGRARHVQIVFAISPGPTVCHADEGDLAALAAKIDAVRGAGIDAFAILFDDIDPALRCERDRRRFGRDASPLAAAQAHLANRVLRDVLARRGVTAPLLVAPTEYAGMAPSPYRAWLAARLDPSAVVWWTGRDVIPATITEAEGRAARELFRHPIALWDNFPVNDYAPRQLVLGPLLGREPGLARALDAFHANPMPEATASRIGLFTVAAYAWNPEAYDARVTWDAALHATAGAAPRDVLEALRAFADLNRQSPLDSAADGDIAQAIARLWGAGSDRRAIEARARDLDARLVALGRVPDRLRRHFAGSRFLTDIAPWLDELTLALPAMRAAVALARAEAQGDAARAWRARLDLEAKLAPLDAARPIVGRDVVDAFLDRVRADHDASLGTVPRLVTTLGSFDDDRRALALDGDPATWWWSGEPPRPGDTVGVDLGAVRDVRGAVLRMGSTGDPDPQPGDYVRGGAIEASEDGSRWRAIGDMAAANVRLAFSPALRARHLRVRATGEQNDWVRVREIEVDADLPRFATIEAESPARLAVDGLPSTAWDVAGTQPLELALPKPTALASLVVLQGTAAVPITIEIASPGGAWTRAGRTRGSHAAFDLRRGVVERIRLTWPARARGARIHEVIATPAD